MDPFSRGSYHSSPLGTSLFILVRLLDIPLQYKLLSSSLVIPFVHSLRLHTVSTGPSVFLGLSSYRLLLLSMSAGAAFKQIFWLLYVSRETMTPVSAFAIGTANWVFNSLNSILYLCAVTSAAGPSESVSTRLIFGSVLYTLGIILETFSEVQRKRFKDKPQNQGRLFTSGLFGWARHINYGGYVLFRSGYAMAASGWIAGALVFAWFARDFATRGIPLLDSYCAKRYGRSWREYKLNVPYKLFPGVY